MVKLITNPSAVFGQTDAESNHFQVIADFVAAEAITRGDGIQAQWDETARTIVAGQADTDDASAYIGIALDSAAAGEGVRVVVFGFALANIGSDTPAAEEVVTATTTAGTLASVAADATTVVGTVFGTVLGDEDGTTNLVPMWVSPR